MPTPTIPRRPERRSGERRRTPRCRARPPGIGGARATRRTEKASGAGGSALPDAMLVIIAARIARHRRGGDARASDLREPADGRREHHEGVTQRRKPCSAPTPKDTSQLAQMIGIAAIREGSQGVRGRSRQDRAHDSARADSIAYYAVRESYVKGIPPAVVFGVMLTENSKFVSGAMSNVGAVGLMQVYPKVWLKALSSKFGKDLASDSTNIKYGIYILKQYIKSDSGSVTQKNVELGPAALQRMRDGLNTPNCTTTRPR